MKVAIIGAGIAGLACAHELEGYGISPTIYEVNSFIGEQYSHVAAILEIADRPIRNHVSYFKSKLNIDIMPLNTVTSIVHNSPNKTTEIKGELGYFFERSKSPQDMKIQLYSKLKNTKVLFNTYGDYEVLCKKYDYVIIANGKVNFTNELGCWLEWLSTYVRGATVLGDFDPQRLTVWLNKDYCKNGYAYMTPYNSKKACITLVVTDVNEKEIDHYWELFLYTENIKYTITEEFKLNHKSGHVYPYRIDNMIFAGNAGGVIDPFLGFGTVSSMTMGIMAARAIAKGKDYESLIKDITKANFNLYEFRKALDRTDNKGYDRLITSIGIPGLKHMVYYTPLNIIKLGGYALKALSKEK